MIRTHTCGELRATDAGKEVVLEGWVDAHRLTGKISFLLIRDRTGITQTFVNKDLTAAHQAQLKPESVVRVYGKVNKRPENQIKREMKTGEVELEATKIEVLNESEQPIPVDLMPETTTSLDKRLDYRFLDVRRQKIMDQFLVRSKVFTKTIEFFEKQGFVNIQTPKLTASGVESGAEEFKLPYFGKTAALAQSPQIYKQMFVISGMEKVYAVEPIFRAENSHTTRHLTEFTGIDFEMGFIENEHDVMDVIEKYIQYMLSAVDMEAKESLQRLNIEIHVPTQIPRLSWKELRKMLEQKGKVLPPKEDPDPEAERMIGQYVKEKYNSDFVFILDYPVEKRAFYHMRPEGDQTITKSFDLIYKGLEIGTGAQREHRLPILIAQAAEKGIDMNQMTFYKDIFRYGAPPHGGVGLGMDRIVKQMLNLENVKEAILLPRDPERLTP